jgi:hypothetical protein
MSDSVTDIPWRARAYFDGHDGHHHDIERWLVEEDVPGTKSTGFVVKVPERDAEAVAKFIATAPAMKKALNAIIDWAENGYTRPLVGEPDWLPEVRRLVLLSVLRDRCALRRRRRLQQEGDVLVVVGIVGGVGGVIRVRRRRSNRAGRDARGRSGWTGRGRVSDDRWILGRTLRIP